MMRLPRKPLSFAVACVVSSLFPVAGFAQSATAPATAPAAAAPLERGGSSAAATNPAVVEAAESFWHYASIGRYELARKQGEQILAANANPRDVLAAFEGVVEKRNRFVSADRRIELYERMLAWQAIPELRDVTAKLLGTFNKAKLTMASDPAFIESNIQRLGGTSRGYALAVEQLKASGELAAPLMLNHLRNPTVADHMKVRIRSAMRDMGYRVLNPMVAATEMKEWNSLPWVAAVLGDIGYQDAAPYLVRLYQSKEVPATIKPAIQNALMRLNVNNPESLDAAQLFYGLAEKCYYDKSSIAATKGSETAYMWFWTAGGLQKKDVPAATFNEHMALRSCEYALELDGNRSDAQSLWIAAAYKREVEGKPDPVWPATHPDAHYYAVVSGTRHLSPALARALRDHNSAVALKAIKSLQEIVGSSNLFSGDENRPVLDAMHYPDRQVRFESAFTVAGALPQKPFTGQQNVVPILAEAMVQTGKPGVLVMASSQNDLNQRMEAIAKAGPYVTRGGVGAEAAIAAAASLGGVDVIVMSEQNADQIDRVFAAVRDNVRLERAAKLIVVTSKVASPYAQLALHDPLVTVTDAKDDAGLAAAIEEARRRSGGLPLDEKVATGYALRAANLLGKLAISRGQVLDLVVAQNALLAALDDPRPEVAEAAAAALAPMQTREAQSALLEKGLDAKTSDDLKLVSFKNMAINAKFFGNQVPAARAEALMKFVESAQNPEIRAAAAEALGALNVNTSQAKNLILNQKQR